MLDVGLIFPVDKLEWISHIVIHSKNDSEEIIIYVDYQGLNATCVTWPISYTFIDEVFDQGVGNEELIYIWILGIPPYCRRG